MRNTAVTGLAIQADAPSFTTDGELGSASVLAWLPILFGLLASALVALMLCPIPRSQTVNLTRALFLAVSYVLLTVAIGAGILAGCGVLAARNNPALFLRQLPCVCTVASWIAPVVAFYRRDSWWTLLAATVLALSGSALVYRHLLALTAGRMSLPTTDSRSGRVRWLTIAVLLLQLAALFTLASLAGLASLLIATAIFVISVTYRTAFGSNRPEPRKWQTLRSAIRVGLAALLVAASLVPYIGAPPESFPSPNSANLSQAIPPPVMGASPKPTHGIFDSGRAAIHRLLTVNPQRPGQLESADRAPNPGPYRALQALFGDRKPAAESELDSAANQLRNGASTVVVTGDSYRGMILRPEVKEMAKIVAPVASPFRFDAKKQVLQKRDPVAIPFYGAYWFFRTSDRTLPPNAIEARGDPRSTAFKTTDFSPMTMEARQSFGSLIDLSCCRAIEVVLSNADRRPGTVAVEVVLTNTGLPGKPHQSLGSLPVNSTLSWIPADNRPPVAEVLRFLVPEQPLIQNFDEVTIRFALGSPREEWSAKIGIEKFRLIPRGL